MSTRLSCYGSASVFASRRIRINTGSVSIVSMPSNKKDFDDTDESAIFIHEIISGITMAENITSLDQVRTVPFDPRFPNQNQTRNCYQNFVDYHRCTRKYGENHEACKYFKKAFNVLCPSEWVERWTEEIEERRFPGEWKLRI